MNNANNNEQYQQTQQTHKQTAFTVKELRIFAYNMNELVAHTRVKKVMGFDKFKRTVKKELDKLQDMGDENRQYSSTSIFYLATIWNYCLEIGLNNVKAICNKIKYEDTVTDKKCTLVVDIITENGLKWIKIKSKNPYSIRVQIIKDDSHSNILQVADNYIKAAKANKIKFRTPKIEFVFAKGITSDVHYMLKTKGIHIKGQVIQDNIFFEEDQEEDQEDTKDEVNNNDEKDEVNENMVNLGPKTMMTMISALSNGEILDEFWQAVENYVIDREDNPDSYRSSIYQQALNFSYNSHITHKLFSGKSTQMLSTMVGNYYEELQYPVMPIIMQYIGTKKLYCCETAWKSVSKLVGLGAGQNEIHRYKQLQSQITIVPDQISQRTNNLKGEGMSNVNRAVFGIGDTLKMLTVSGAPTFVRKARQKGIEYLCKTHDVRPFIEQYQVGFQIFKINKGFDIGALKRKMEEDDVDLNFDDYGDSSKDQCDGNASGCVEIQEEFENLHI